MHYMYALRGTNSTQVHPKLCSITYVATKVHVILQIL